MLICAVALVMIGVMSVAAIPTEKAAIGESKLLKDGMYNSKNAGQKVTLILDYKRLEHGLDKQMGLEFWATLVRRDVERFERREGGGYHWKKVSINAVDPLRYKTLHGQTDKGDRVSLDPAFEEKITTNENLGVDDLTDWSLKDFKNGDTKRKFHAKETDEITYFTNAGDVAFKDLSKASPVKLDAQVGKFRVKYTKMELNQKAVAVTGVQRGHMIKVDPDVGKPIVTRAKANKLFNKQDVIDRMQMNRVIVFATSLVGAIILALFGLGWLGAFSFRDKRKSMAKADARRKREELAETEEEVWEKGGDVSRNEKKTETPAEAKENRDRDYIGEDKKKRKLERKQARKKKKGEKKDTRFQNNV